MWAATSNGASLWRLGPGPAGHGELLSPALDARRIARFGRVLVHGELRGTAAAVDTFLTGSTTLPSPIKPTERPLVV